MSTIHGLAALALGGVTGVQASQRDWSPFLVHFTSYSAMAEVKRSVVCGTAPEDVRARLELADRISLETFQLIADSTVLRASHPGGHTDIPECVCLSECSLPGLIALSERFGRFGFVFRKDALFALGSRPCLYLAASEYAVIARFRSQGVGTPEGRLWGLSNVYRPAGAGQVQDFTHEREWRHFGDLSLVDATPEAVIAPRAFLATARQLFPGCGLQVPLDTLFEWGA